MVVQMLIEHINKQKFEKKEEKLGFCWVFYELKFERQRPKYSVTLSLK